MPLASKAKMDEAGPLRRFQPMVEDAMTCPDAFVERREFVMDGNVSAPSEAVCEKRFVDDAVVEKMVVVVAFASVVAPEKVFVPENVLLFASSVDDAAVMVMSAEPLKEVPLMVRAVWSVVAVEALPVRDPTKVVNHAVVPERRVVDAFAKELRPVQVLLLERSVEEAAVTVTEPPALKVVPLIVPREPVR